MTQVEVWSADQAAQHLGALADILVDAVDSGASVSFMSPFTREQAHSFWGSLLPAVRAGRILMLGGFVERALVGTVQLHLSTPPNQPHRAEVAKLLVHRRARRRGVARTLMTRVEELARARGRSLLTFDTLTGSAAEELYLSLGYVRAGIIPGYALLPTGEPASTSIFYKALR